MVQELFMVHSKEIVEKFFKRSLFNYPKSMVEVVNHQFVLPD